MNAAQRRSFRRAHAITPGAAVKRQTSKGVLTVARMLYVDPEAPGRIIVKRKDNQRASWGLGEIVRAMAGV